MNVAQGSFDETELYLGFLSHFRSEEAKRAFVFLHLNFARLDSCICLAGRHGMMKSLRVYDGGEWSYSFAPAQNWTKAWIRPPEIRKGRITIDDLTPALPQAEDRGDDHLVVRLHDLGEARAFYDAVASSRQ